MRAWWMAFLVACGGGVATVKDAGPQGTFVGKLEKGDQVIAKHEVVVMTDGRGQPQLGLWEFCNIDLVGGGPDYEAAAGSSCMVDLGDGKKKGRSVSGKARFDGQRWTAEMTFEGGVVWRFDGGR